MVGDGRLGRWSLVGRMSAKHEVHLHDCIRTQMYPCTAVAWELEEEENLKLKVVRGFTEWGGGGGDEGWGEAG